jgi:ankyrin repeat protein
MSEAEALSPLARALLQGDAKAAEALVSGPATARELHLALRGKRKAVLKKMLAAGTRAEGEHEGWSALHTLVDGLRDAAFAKALIQVGAPVDALDPYGRTALSQLMPLKAPELIEVLAKAGDVNARNGALPNNTALQVACATKTGEMSATEAANAALLLSLGADPNIANADGYTALQIAAQYATLDVIAALFAHGATVAACQGFSPLHLAAGRDQDGLFELLLAQGDALEGRSANGDTPLLVAARKSAGAVRRLLALGADRGAQRPDGSDAVAVATLYGRNDVLAALR